MFVQNIISVCAFHCKCITVKKKNNKLKDLIYKNLGSECRVLLLKFPFCQLVAFSQEYTHL